MNKTSPQHECSRRWITLYARHEIASINRACALARAAIHTGMGACQPGVSTAQVADIIHAFLVQAGGRAAFVDYTPTDTPAHTPFPAAACISVNEDLIHAPPSDRRLVPGDLVSIDVGVELDGFFGDVAETRIVAPEAEKAKEHESSTLHARLRIAARATVAAAIRACRPGVQWSTVARAAREKARAHGCRILPGYCGHGIGKKLHEPPHVIFEIEPGENDDFLLVPGMVLTIEPIVLASKSNAVLAADTWTVRSRDGSPGCHVEHMVAVMRDGVRLLGAGKQSFLSRGGL